MRRLQVLHVLLEGVPESVVVDRRAQDALQGAPKVFNPNRNGDAARLGHVPHLRSNLRGSPAHASARPVHASRKRRNPLGHPGPTTRCTPCPSTASHPASPSGPRKRRSARRTKPRARDQQRVVQERGKGNSTTALQVSSHWGRIRRRPFVVVVAACYAARHACDGEDGRRGAGFF